MEELKTEILEPEKKQEKYSYSKIDTYKQCPFRYKLRYVDGHYVSADSIATEFGTLVHETEEAIGNCLKEKKPIDYIALKNNFIKTCAELEHKYPKAYMELDKSNRTYKQKAYEYLESGIYRLEKYMQEHTNIEVIGCEVEFDFLFNGTYLFHGFIDRIFYDTITKKYIVQDIKTYAVPVARDKLATPLQFVVYTMAIADKYRISYEDISCQYDLPLCNLTQDAGTNGYMSRGYMKLVELFSSIDGKDYKPNPTPLCAFCEYSRTSEINKKVENYHQILCPYNCLWTRERKIFATENQWSGLEQYPILLENLRKKYHLN